MTMAHVMPAHLLFIRFPAAKFNFSPVWLRHEPMGAGAVDNGGRVVRRVPHSRRQADGLGFTGMRAPDQKVDLEGYLAVDEAHDALEFVRHLWPTMKVSMSSGFDGASTEI